MPQPEVVNGVKQKPISGVSMYYTFDKANATVPSHKHTPYFEMGTTRAIYHVGWIAATTHGVVPWADPKPHTDFENDV